MQLQNTKIQPTTRTNILQNTNKNLYRTKQKNNSPTEEQFSNFQKAYDYFNKELFSGILPDCFLNFFRSHRYAGCFINNLWKKGDKVTSQISLNSIHLWDEPIEIMSTLVHEMCHLWQFEFGKPSRSGYHNREFAAKMESVGLITSTTGREGGNRTGQGMSEYILKGGLFEQKFNEMPKEYLLPWVDNFSDASSLNNPTTPQRRNKIKYSCPACFTNVWGKPGLSIICGDCDQEFFQVSS